MSKKEPTPFKISSRICFGIAYFDNLKDAEAYAEIIRERGNTYNGGFYHGMACGRETTWDHIDKDTGKQLYAVTR